MAQLSCSNCGGLFKGRNCPSCSTVGAGSKFVHNPNPFPYDNTLTFITNHHSTMSRHTRVSYVETILTMVMIVHHGYCLSMSRNQATIKTLVIIIIHKIHRVFHNNIFAVTTMGVLMKVFNYPSDQSPPKEMSIQDMDYLKQQYLNEMESMINLIQIEDYHNERFDIHYRRECEIKIDELKDNFNGMIIEINKKKELRQQEQAVNLSTYTTDPS
uniref:Uncharacterized protein n=1 Tax=Tanacetum cinerariifolium TaxID=118510 RepID=A0A6L2MU65_TANCI|nr:hypothetical protein [Tanacetum cinerariifolium]